MSSLEQRVDRLEEMFGRFLEETSRILAAIHEDVSEIRVSNARTDRQLLLMQQQAEKDRQQAEKDRKDFNRRLAELSDAQGLLIENMVWPNLRRISEEVFGGDVVVTQAIRVKRVHPKERGRVREIDLLAASPRFVLICEAKSKPTSEKVREFLASLETFKEFFPEYEEMTLIPMMASIAFEATLVSFMTSQGVLALGFGDETMELLNPEVARQIVL